MWKYGFFRRLETSLRPPKHIDSTSYRYYCTRKVQEDQSTKSSQHFVRQCHETEFKILKNNHYVIPSELLSTMDNVQTWGAFFDKLSIFTAAREVDTMFSYVIHRLNLEKENESSLSISQWVSLIDASVFADIELESVGYVVPVSERQPCCKTGALTLQLIDHFFRIVKPKGTDEFPLEILTVALSVFQRLKIVQPVKTLFDKCFANLAQETVDSPAHSLLWKYLRNFMDSIIEMDMYDCGYCLQAIDVVVSCVEKLCTSLHEGTLSESDRSDASHILACIARLCTHFTVEPYRTQQEQFTSHLQDALLVKEFLVKKNITQRILDGPFRLLEIKEVLQHDSTNNNVDGEPQDPCSVEKTEDKEGDRKASIISISANERHKQTLELFHKYSNHRTISHFEGLIIYHLTGQLQSNLNENNMKGFRTAAVETLRQMTLECGEKKLGTLVKEHNEKFQFLHKVVICAMCQPYFNQCLSNKHSSGRTIIDCTNLPISPPAEDAMTAYQIFLIHRNYGYVPERIAMNALIKALSERGEAAVFNIVDITVQNYKGAPLDSPKHRGIRNTKPVDYFTIEYLIKTCFVAKDNDRARHLYWIMCEQFPGLQHRMTQKTKDYLTAMEISNFSPPHIFSSENIDGIKVSDLPKSPT
ncbi:pentatricopeptide repeat-containing protein [Perkinsela sp. CCAP 1560/4]|nr:pentatricopeptide repeat-containing protein [Perkinsela sp. CCAP 1560/4]|eukprot:KNH03642.1 pentatricopeptide repeat-containing protein [Perkinsela sp. CCAP 1560/4]